MNGGRLGVFKETAILDKSMIVAKTKIIKRKIVMTSVMEHGVINHVEEKGTLGVLRLQVM